VTAPTHRVLLIDDDESIRMLLSLILERAGYEVFNAENGVEGLKVLESEPVDVILLDLMMPVMDGLRFLEEARGKSAIDTPILVLSGSINTHAGSIEDIVEAGATDVACKPIAAPDLIGRIEHLLGAGS
jgi:CheY-like chemotaxis protein